MYDRRYQISDSILINAPIEQVFAIASDPGIVPFYAHEIDRIEIIDRVSEHRAHVKSYLRLAGMTWGVLYQFHYRRPTHYSGVQEGSNFLRGFFTLTFESCNGGTVVSHTEGILSRIPLLAGIAGFVYFRVLASGAIRSELGSLKQLVESETPTVGER